MFDFFIVSLFYFLLISYVGFLSERPLGWRIFLAASAGTYFYAGGSAWWPIMLYSTADVTDYFLKAPYYHSKQLALPRWFISDTVTTFGADGRLTVSAHTPAGWMIMTSVDSLLTFKEWRRNDSIAFTYCICSGDKHSVVRIPKKNLERMLSHTTEQLINSHLDYLVERYRRFTDNLFKSEATEKGTYRVINTLDNYCFDDAGRLDTSTVIDTNFIKIQIHRGRQVLLVIPLQMRWEKVGSRQEFGMHYYDVTNGKKDWKQLRDFRVALSPMRFTFGRRIYEYKATLAYQPNLP